MSLFWHKVLQIGATILQVANVALPFVPAPYNLIITAVLGGIQGGVAIYNHNTPAK